MFNSMKKNSVKQLVFLTMLFGLMIGLNGSVSAQDKCGEPNDDQVIIYEHVFQAGEDVGGCKVLEVGEYKNAAAMGLGDDIMSSIKVGKNVYAEVCSGKDFTGACELFDKHDADLRNNPTIKNDTVSSVKVVKVDNSKSAKICTMGGDKEVAIAWTNKTNRTLRINWVSYDCEEENNTREIKPGQVYDGVSYAGHIFVVRDFKSKEQLGHIIVTTSNGTQELK